MLPIAFSFLDDGGFILMLYAAVSHVGVVLSPCHRHKTGTLSQATVPTRISCARLWSGFELAAL